MRLAIYVQGKFYRFWDLGDEVTRYNYGEVASEISHEINQGLWESYDPAGHFSLSIVPITE